MLESVEAPSATDVPNATRVLEIVSRLAEELGGERARRAASLTASLDGEVGLGSLERVELLLRLEKEFSRRLDDRFLELDTVLDIARALVEAPRSEATAPRLTSRIASPRSTAAAHAPAVTLCESLLQRAEDEPDRVHVILPEETPELREATYGSLLDRARTIAGALKERGVRNGERVALMLPTGFDFLSVFMGVLFAGAVPVPLYPPMRLNRLEEYARRQAAILRDAGARLLVTFPKAAPIAAMLKGTTTMLDGVIVAEELGTCGSILSIDPGRGSSPALVQYTSGSTGDPKGALLSHESLLANIRAIAIGVDLRSTDVGVSWLPLYHDMGLIGSWLFCLDQGVPLVLLSPTSFLARPERWLWTVHEHRATLSAAPNFAFELCMRKIPDAACEGLDLSSWRCALNGAETVNPDTLERFVGRFGRHGFRREALMPVYGLAESAVALCFPPLDRGPRVERLQRDAMERLGRAVPAADGERSAARLVSVGAPLHGHEVRIVDDGGEEAPERVVGRLVFRGPSSMSGYFGKPEATAMITLPGGWLDSGDLAFRFEGEIFITGRRKDVIIRAGRNLAPQEVEEAACSVEGVRKGSAAAFGVRREDLGTEGLVVVVETRIRAMSERARIEADVISRIVAAVDVPPDAVVIAPPGTVPKTSSGKVRRSEARARYLAGALVPPSRPALAMRARLALAGCAVVLRRGIAAVTRGVYALYVAVVAGALAAAVWPLVALLDARASRTLARAGSRLFLRLIGCPLAVEGVERIVNAERPVVIVANHASYLDALALLAALPLDFIFLAKREIEDWRFIGTFLRKGRHLTVDRLDVSKSAVAAHRVQEAIAGGESVLIFPEATFTARAGLRPFRLGAFQIALATRRPVVPVALDGTRRVLRDKTWIPRRGPIRVGIGEPLIPEGEGFRAVVRLRDRAVSVIARQCGERPIGIVAGGYRRPPDASRS
ncbi:MAG: AMP-binding protein [Vicinamibacteria bacterium]|nr:AMP-binding protein [Vicinamibacteria bacterium]